MALQMRPLKRHRLRWLLSVWIAGKNAVLSITNMHHSTCKDRGHQHSYRKILAGSFQLLLPVLNFSNSTHFLKEQNHVRFCIKTPFFGAFRYVWCPPFSWKILLNALKNTLLYITNIPDVGKLPLLLRELKAFNEVYCFVHVHPGKKIAQFNLRTIDPSILPIRTDHTVPLGIGTVSSTSC